jgi:acyl-CoA synthetase (NDP forming)
MSARTDEAVHMMLEPEAAQVLGSFGLAYVAHGVAGTADEAVTVARDLGFPVVLKVVSADVVHKTDVGGVLVGLADEAAVRAGYAGLLAEVGRRAPAARVVGVLVARQVSGGRELILGALHDPIFGPTVMVGLGGVFAEALADVSFRLAPLRHDDALEMLSELRGAELLGAHRGAAAVDRDAVAAMCVKLGLLIRAHPEISEIDLNPVAATADGCVVLDARILARGATAEGGASP